jgi:hypothetical protein
MNQTSPSTGSSASICRDGLNLLTGRRVAIVFVPGVMGSRVELPDADDAWDPDRPVGNMLGWAWANSEAKRDLLDSSTRGVIARNPASRFGSDHAGRVERGWGGVRWASYGTFLEALGGWTFGANQTPVYAYGYDWRQPIAQIGLQMAADILGASQSSGGRNAVFNQDRFGATGLIGHADTEEILFITHSMGGLVTRMALKQCAALREKTVAVLHGVQPATGGPLLYRRMVTGVFSPIDGSGFEAMVFRNIIGPGPGDMSTILSRCPGPMQLLPSNLLRDACATAGAGMITWTEFEESRSTIHAVTESVYEVFRRDETARPPGIVRSTLAAPIRTNIGSRISGIQAFHDLLGSWKLEEKTWAFYGSGLGTDHTVHFDCPPVSHRVEVDVVGVGMGDGVVVENIVATDPSGRTVYLDEVTDLERRGFNPNPTLPGAPSTAPVGHGPHGDETVPRLSGAALFPPSETTTLTSSGTVDFATHRQVNAPGVQHEPAFRDAGIQRLVRSWIQHVISTV